MDLETQRKILKLLNIALHEVEHCADEERKITHDKFRAGHYLTCIRALEDEIMARHAVLRRDEVLANIRKG